MAHLAHTAYLAHSTPFTSHLAPFTFTQHPTLITAPFTTYGIHQALPVRYQFTATYAQVSIPRSPVPLC